MKITFLLNICIISIIISSCEEKQSVEKSRYYLGTFIESYETGVVDNWFAGRISKTWIKTSKGTFESYKILNALTKSDIFRVRNLNEKNALTLEACQFKPFKTCVHLRK